MKKYLLFAMLLPMAITAQAIDIHINVDAAPNVYGSPDYAAWQADAFAQAANGTFVNMNSSVNPLNVGTTHYDIKDVTVYSFGDLGRRLSFVYWVPGETIANLQAHNFQVSLSYDWAGTTYDLYTSIWQTPTSWQEYNGGVIGVAGFAWWGAYTVNTQAALDADLAAWDPYSGDITLHARVDGGAEVSLTAEHSVPDLGSTIMLLGTAVSGLGFMRRKMHA